MNICNFPISAHDLHEWGETKMANHDVMKMATDLKYESGYHLRQKLLTDCPGQEKTRTSNIKKQK